MNWDTVKGNWKQFKGKVKEEWGDLTDDHLDQIDGKREQLAGKVQETHGISKDAAEKQIKDFEERHMGRAECDLLGFGEKVVRPAIQHHAANHL